MSRCASASIALSDRRSASSMAIHPAKGAKALKAERAARVKAAADAAEQKLRARGGAKEQGGAREARESAGDRPSDIVEGAPRDFTQANKPLVKDKKPKKKPKPPRPKQWKS